MNGQMIDLRQLDGLVAEMVPLAAEAEREGYGFVRRLRDDWLSSANRFDRPGELLIGIRDGYLVAVGGLNADPYAPDGRVGRLRHVYVLADRRRSGIGTALVERLMAQAAAHFSLLRLRTDTAAAAAFYERLGFRRIDDDTATHIIDL
jgi:GNAT superfamily N-acetyltransferase